MRCWERKARFSFSALSFKARALKHFCFKAGSALKHCFKADCHFEEEKRSHFLTFAKRSKTAKFRPKTQLVPSSLPSIGPVELSRRRRGRTLCRCNSGNTTFGAVQRASRKRKKRKQRSHISDVTSLFSFVTHLQVQKRGSGKAANDY